VRFFLDHDVDARVAQLLRRRGHEAWTAAEAGLFKAGDDDLTVYAQDRNATLVTHDREFSARRRRNPAGRHVELRCREPDAVDVLPAILDRLVAAVEPFDDVYAYVSRERIELHQRWE